MNKDDYEIIAQIDSYALLRIESGKSSYIFSKISEDGCIENSIELIGFTEIPTSELGGLGNNNVSCFKLVGVLTEVLKDYSRNKGFGKVEHNNTILGFYFNNNNKELTKSLTSSIDKFVVLTGTYDNNTNDSNPKKPIFNIVDKIEIP
jgi:hypothetical protein